MRVPATKTHQLQRKSNLNAQAKSNCPSEKVLLNMSYQPFVKESTIEVMNIISDVVKQNAKICRNTYQKLGHGLGTNNHGFCRASSNTAHLSSDFLHRCEDFNFNKLSTKIRTLGSRSVHVMTLCTYRLQGFQCVGGVCLP